MQNFLNHLFLQVMNQFQNFKKQTIFYNKGIVLNENLKWLSFHGGFDFGYMLKLLTNTKIPTFFEEFNEILKIYFPNLYDLKFQIQDFDSFRYDGLSRLAQGMKVKH